MDILSQLAANFVSITGVPESGGMSILSSTLASANIPELLTTLFNAAIGIGAMLAVLRIAYGGFLYMASDIGGTKEKAKRTIREALIGLVLLLAIVLILEQINQNITNLDFTQSLRGQRQ